MAPAPIRSALELSVASPAAGAAAGWSREPALAAPFGFTGTWAVTGAGFFLPATTVNSPVISRSTQVNEIG